MSVFAVLLIVCGALAFFWFRKQNTKKDPGVCTDMVVYTPPTSKSDLIRSYLRSRKMLTVIEKGGTIPNRADPASKPDQNPTPPTRKERESSGSNQGVTSKPSRRKKILAITLVSLVVGVIGALCGLGITSILAAENVPTKETSVSEVAASSDAKSSILLALGLIVLMAIFAFARHNRSGSGFGFGVDKKSIKSFVEWVSNLFETKINTGDNDPNNDRLKLYAIIFIVGYYGIAFTLWRYAPTLFTPWRESPLMFFGLLPAAILLIAYVKKLGKFGLTGVVGVLLLLITSIAIYQYSHVTPVSKALGSIKETFQQKDSNNISTSFTAKPHIWTSVEMRPGEGIRYGYKLKIKPEEKILVRANGRSPVNDGPGIRNDFGQDVKILEIMSDVGHDVEVPTVFYFSP